MAGDRPFWKRGMIGAAPFHRKRAKPAFRLIFLAKRVGEEAPLW